MTRILRSIAIRFPLLLGAIVVAVSVVSGRIAQREIGDVLEESATEDLADAATQLAQMLASGIPTARRNLTEAAQHPELRSALSTAADTAAARAALSRYAARQPSATRAALRLLTASGDVRATWSVLPGANSMGWTAGLIDEGVLPQDSATIGPIIALNDSIPGFVLVAPVTSPSGGPLGWVEEVHTARGQGVADVRALIGVERLLVGSRSWTVWTDLSTVVPAPAFTAMPDSAQRIVATDGKDVLGLARPVRGTPWLVWVERPHAEVMAPIERYLQRMWLATVLIALAGAGLAWVLGRYLSSRIRVVAVELDRTLTSRGAVPDARADSDAADELRQLEESYAALEARVEQRRRLDDQLLQAQKLEAVGRLAGGIAHDFNNLLTVMSSYAALARENLAPDSPEAQDLDQVLKAIDRATALTRQLLTFSRQRINDLRPLDLNDVVRNTDSMLSRLIPSNVERVFELADDLPLVEADHTQIEQVLINLVVNAVDAMPDGGRIVVRSTRERVAGLRGGDASGPELDCVCLAVTDSGVGMDADTLARIFDPFFTTKPLGKGTGLGLATVHGIAHALGGRVVPYSEPGQGTSMRVYLPVAAGQTRGGDVPSPTSAKVAASPAGLVLVAEDDAATRRAVQRILESAGHRVLTFVTADDCLDWLDDRQRTEVPVAVISDVMMPGLNGIAFAALLRERHPRLPIVLVSGYADVRDRIPADYAARPVILEKPFTAAAVHDALRRAMSRTTPTSPQL